MAIKNAGLKPSDIQLIIVATITPDHPFPSTACLLQEKLEIKHIPAFDVSAACTGFIYASDIARQYIENGVYENILVIGAETLTRITNMNDRNTCVLFGDGAGAVVYSLAHEADIEKFIDSHIEADGSKWKLLQQKAGGSCLPSSKQTVEENLHTIYMEGNKIFKFATKTMVNTCNVLIKRNELELNDINWLIPHQANSRIIQSVGKKLKIDPTKVIVNIQKYGNTSSATIPIALAEAIEMQIIRKRDLVLVTAFGGGLTAGSMLIRI
mmetsp:Transcript_14121/g.6971  ORF Transcript_14121/g.6971 Transcript_14121/m.6971 type:complete len:268 (+) Transcript_14121:1-804(+)